MTCLGLLMLTLTPLTRADAPERKVLLRDITDIEGVRDNRTEVSPHFVG